MLAFLGLVPQMRGRAPQRLVTGEQWVQIHMDSNGVSWDSSESSGLAGSATESPLPMSALTDNTWYFLSIEMLSLDQSKRRWVY